MFGRKKPSSSPSPSRGLRDPVEVQGIGVADGRPFSFKTNVEKEDVWSKHMVTEAAKSEHKLTGSRVEIRKWGTVESGRLDYP